MRTLPALRWAIVDAVAASLAGCHVPFVSKGGGGASSTAALASEWNSISAAQGQGKTLTTEAQALATTAQRLASQHGC